MQLSISHSVEPAEFVLVEGASEQIHFRLQGDETTREDVRALCFVSTGTFVIQTTIHEKAEGRVVSLAKLTVTVHDIDVKVSNE
jgi:hypothetical protein